MSWKIHDEREREIELVPTDGTGFSLSFLPVPDPEVGKYRIHVDLVTETPDHRTQR